MAHQVPFLPTPPSAGVLRRCDRCRRWFALEFQHKFCDKTVGEVRTYRCKYCGCEIRFAEKLPARVLSSQNPLSR